MTRQEQQDLLNREEKTIKDIEDVAAKSMKAMMVRFGSTFQRFPFHLVYTRFVYMVLGAKNWCFSTPIRCQQLAGWQELFRRASFKRDPAIGKGHTPCTELKSTIIQIKQLMLFTAPVKPHETHPYPLNKASLLMH